MSIWFILFSMVFCHVIADYNLQGWLATAKQKEWWDKNYPQKMYKNDYKMALFMHCISWTFMVMLVPSLIYSKFYLIIFILNVICHYVIDNAKVNNKTLNLIEDQTLHTCQIVVTFLAYVL